MGIAQHARESPLPTQWAQTGLASTIFRTLEICAVRWTVVFTGKEIVSSALPLVTRRYYLVTQLESTATQWTDLKLTSHASSPSTSKASLTMPAPPLMGIGPGAPQMSLRLGKELCKELWGVCRPT